METEKKIYTVDNIEGEFATVEAPDSKIIIVPIELLPEGIEEFDLMEIVERRFVYLEQKTDERKWYIAQRFEDLWQENEEDSDRFL